MMFNNNNNNNKKNQSFLSKTFAIGLLVLVAASDTNAAPVASVQLKDAAALTCPSTYHITPNGSPFQLCGGSNMGGAKCASSCCKVQDDYCNNAFCGLDNQCVSTCLSQRGCCPVNYTVAPLGTLDQKCGGVNQGGDACKVSCCSQQSSYCHSACTLFGSTECINKCESERGC